MAHCGKLIIPALLALADSAWKALQSPLNCDAIQNALATIRLARRL